MMECDREQGPQGIACCLWINGVREATTMIWLSDTHTEVLLDETIELAVRQPVALVVHGFVSIPMRAELQEGRHVVFRFNNPPHPSVRDMLRANLIAAGNGALRDALEEQAIPGRAPVRLARPAAAQDTRVLSDRAA